jgi:predicted MFS family arabinose efflux permease
VPIGIATFTIGALLLKEHRERSDAPFDVLGFVLSGVGLASLLYTLSEGPTKGWASATIITTGTVGVAAAVLLVWWELRIEHPMLALRLLRRRLFGLANLTQVFVHASFLGLLFLVALFLQQARGLSPLQTGLTVFPEAIGVIVSAQVIGRIYPRVGPRRLVGAGLMAGAVVMALFATIDADTSLWTIRLLMFAAGATVACSFVSLQVGTFAAISPADTGRASAIFATLGHAGAAMGVALGATTLATLLPSPDGVAATDERLYRAFHAAFFVVAGLAMLGSLVAWRLRDSDAASTLRKHAQPSGPPVDVDVRAM